MRIVARYPGARNATLHPEWPRELDRYSRQIGASDEAWRFTVAVEDH